MPRSDSRERLVGATASLLRERGYHGTGLREIVQRSGAPRGSLYFLFPGGKDQLAAAAVRASARQVREGIEQVFAVHADVGEALRAFVGIFGEQLQASGYALACPVAPAALGAPDGGELHEAVREAFEQWQQAIVERLRAERVAEDRAQSLAALALSAVEGALLLSQVRRDVTTLLQVGQDVGELLSAAVLKAAGGRETNHAKENL